MEQFRLMRGITSLEHIMALIRPSCTSTASKLIPIFLPVLALLIISQPRKLALAQQFRIIGDILTAFLTTSASTTAPSPPPKLRNSTTTPVLPPTPLLLQSPFPLLLPEPLSPAPSRFPPMLLIMSWYPASSSSLTAQTLAPKIPPPRIPSPRVRLQLPMLLIFYLQ